MEIIWRVISGEGEGDNGEKVQGIRSINGRYKIDRGRLRIVWEMEKPKNLYVRTTHGHELRGGDECWWEGCSGWREIKGRKKWDNCNSIINKIYLKRKKI